MNHLKKILPLLWVAVCVHEPAVLYAQNSAASASTETVIYRNLNGTLLPAIDGAGPVQSEDSVKIGMDLFDHSEYMECQDVSSESYKEGWRFDEDESSCRFQSIKTVPVAALPYRTSVGYFSIKLSESGKASINYCYGDCDGGAKASVQLPMVGGKLLFGDHPHSLSLSGGDYASGYWSVSANVKINQ